MERKQDKNLRPCEYKLSQEEQKRGGRRSVEVRRQKKTIAEYLKTWADKEVDEKNKKALQALGLDEEATNRTLLVLPLIKKANGGDIKALQMIIELLGEDKKKDLEIAKLKEEIKILKMQRQMSNSATTDVEDLTPLAELLNDENGID